MSVPGNSTRPTTDKVKESLFNMIGPYFQGGVGLDLFAGSGGLGVEGISRGLDKVIFVDKDPKAIQTVKENVKICAFEKQSEIYRNDWKRALKAISKRDLTFRVIWLDPPYKNNVYIEILEFIQDHNLLDDDGVIVCEHSNEVELPEVISQFKKWKYEEYGMIRISIYRKEIEREA